MNCLLKHVTAGKIEEMTGRQGRRRIQLLDDLREKTEYCKLNAETVDHTPWRTCFERRYRPVLRQTTEWMSISVLLAELSRLPVNLYQPPATLLARLWPEDRSLLIHGSVWGWNVFNLSSSPLTSYVQQRRLRQTHIAWIRNDYTTLSVGFMPRSGATFRQSKQRYSLARSSASAAVYLNFSVFSVIKQRRLVKHRRFGKTYRSHLQGSYLHSHELTT